MEQLSVEEMSPKDTKEQGNPLKMIGVKWVASFLSAVFLCLAVFLMVRAYSSVREEVNRLKDEVKELREQVNFSLNSTEHRLQIAGPPGQKGEMGSIGNPGRDGHVGEKGDMGHPGLAGVTGYPGDKGEIGPVGPPGVKGDQGDQGNSGPPGIPGAKGDQGDFGPPGSPGIPGPPGSMERPPLDFPSNCTTQHRYSASSSTQYINYPTSGPYGHHLDVCYIVAPRPGGTVIITVTKIETEATHDYLEIFKSTDGVLSSLDKLSGGLGSSLNRRFTGNVDEPLLLRFHSDQSVAGTGFSLSYVSG